MVRQCPHCTIDPNRKLCIAFHLFRISVRLSDENCHKNISFEDVLCVNHYYLDNHPWGKNTHIFL